MKGVTNILVVGIGGQGVMTAAEVLSEAAMGLGLDVKKTEVAGMAQRGGVVSSHVRVGKRVFSPEIDRGEADILVAFEAAEALRWSSHLRKGATALINTLRLVPTVVSLGLFEYPADPVEAVRASGARVHGFDAGAIARQLGDLRLVNTVMLGAIAEDLPFPSDVLRRCVVARFLARKPKLAEANERAFEAGRRARREGGQSAANA